ncbi:MAG: BON domain-containing protein [SAR324 cluster bacterium]|nr:BON domain-containing protein [SAR324 cluster bacterium]
MTDEELKVSIVNSMSWDSRVDASKVKVEIRDGFVSLTGCVPTYRSKIAALENVVGFIDARRVENNIRVEYLLTEPRPNGSEIIDKAKQILLWNSDLDVSNVDVVYEGGILTLQGTVPYYWQMERTEDLLSGMHFVSGIKNELAVVPTRKISDQNIAQEIVQALERSEFLDFNTINVKVVHGHVTLTGQVSTTFANWQVARTVSQTDGVQMLSNHLSVRYENI